MYKERLREFLPPVPKADNVEERLQLDGAQNSSLVPLKYTITAKAREVMSLNLSIWKYMRAILLKR